MERACHIGPGSAAMAARVGANAANAAGMDSGASTSVAPCGPSLGGHAALLPGGARGPLIPAAQRLQAAREAA